MKLKTMRTSAVLSRFAESEAFGLPKGRISFSRPRQTGDFNEASRDCIQFKFPYIYISAIDINRPATIRNIQHILSAKIRQEIIPVWY